MFMDPWSNCACFSPNRANLSSLSADSFTCLLLPRPKDSLRLLLRRTCASKHPWPILHSPPLSPPTRRVGGTPGPRVAKPPTPSRDRSSPAGTFLLYSGQRVLSSPPNSWASNRAKTDPRLLEPPAPGCRTSTIWRRRHFRPRHLETWRHLPVSRLILVSVICTKTRAS